MLSVEYYVLALDDSVCLGSNVTLDQARMARAEALRSKPRWTLSIWRCRRHIAPHDPIPEDSEWVE